jgi:hypothetical protein
MSADTQPLTKVDSAVDGLSTSPPKEKEKRRASSSVPGVYNILDLGKCCEVAACNYTCKEQVYWMINPVTKLTLIFNREGRNRDFDRKGDPETELVCAHTVCHA